MEPRRRPQTVRRRPRRGSLERPINGRAVRGTLLLVALPLLVAAFTVARPEALPARAAAAVRRRDGGCARRGARLRAPRPLAGLGGAIGAARWFSSSSRCTGSGTRPDVWREHVPGLGDVELRNLVAVVRGPLAGRHRRPGEPRHDRHRSRRERQRVRHGGADRAGAWIRGVGHRRRPRPAAAHARARLHRRRRVRRSGSGERFASTSPYRGRLLAVVALEGTRVPRAAAARHRR